ncbi:MAG: DUF721 domain-containing protein [Candidatus Neomarinimicrobiota bacterium]
MPSLATAIASALKENGWENVVEQHKVFTYWEEIVGETIAANSYPVEMKGSVLIVKVKNAAWRSELSFQRDEILASLNQRSKSIRIKDIKLR